MISEFSRTENFKETFDTFRKQKNPDRFQSVFAESKLLPKERYTRDSTPGNFQNVKKLEKRRIKKKRLSCDNTAAPKSGARKSVFIKPRISNPYSLEPVLLIRKGEQGFGFTLKNSIGITSEKL